MVNLATFLKVVLTVMTLSTAAVLGVLTRRSLNLVFGPDVADVTSLRTALFYDLPSNVLGSFVLGAFTTMKTRVTIAPVVTVAVSTGYAGSVTTFASWNYQIVNMFARGDWVAGLFAIVIGIAMAYFALHVGCDFATFVLHICKNDRTSRSEGVRSHRVTGENGEHENEEDPDVDFDPDVDPGPDVASKDSVHSEAPQQSLHTTVVWLCVALPLCTLLVVATATGAIFDRDHPTRRGIWASAAFAPLGASTRWILSRWNDSGTWFPRGTLVANLLGTLLDAAIGAAALRHGISSNINIVLNALISGFAGSLSTVSTWVNEAAAMSTSRRYFYLIGSIAAAQIIAITVYGTTYWVKHRNI